MEAKMTTSSPTSSFQRRRLRESLRRIREQAQLTQEQAALSMEWSQSKLIRIELGSVGISVTDLRALLALYQVTDRTVIDELLSLARMARKRSWLSPYKSVLRPGFLTFLELEPDASVLRIFQASVIPGILHTRAYAEEIITETSAPSEMTRERIDLIVEIRMRRQREVFDQPNPPTLVVVLDEAALRRTVGGRQVTREQLLHVARIAELDYVHITVLPFRTGAYAGIYGPFIIADFPDPQARPILYQEGAFGDQVVREKTDLLDNYRKTFDHMVMRALDETESLAFIRRVAAEME
jgi:transcriptional regulator with XRE-family HTH domain